MRTFSLFLAHDSRLLFFCALEFGARLLHIAQKCQKPPTGLQRRCSKFAASSFFQGQRLSYSVFLFLSKEGTLAFPPFQ